tara:strand:+ start:3402 stop:4814 length:1413 start_codon:yes stop_codon:yes gene_type:complete
MAFNSGIMTSGTPGQALGTAGGSVAANLDSTRRLFNFGERIAELAPERSPFFTYLSKVSKVPTDDPEFKYLTDRTKISWTNRTFVITAAKANDNAALSTGDLDANDPVWFDHTTESGLPTTLIPGMVIEVERVVGNIPKPVVMKIEAVTAEATGAGGSYEVKASVVENNGDPDTTIANGSVAQVIGTAFGEATQSPAFFTEELGSDYGMTQIFKTACEWSGSTLATRYRGYPSERDRTWAAKLIEHAVDLERAMLFGQKGVVNSIRYSDGAVSGAIRTAIAGSGFVTGATAWAYASGASYGRAIEYSAMSYDQLLADSEVLFDPARGGSSDRLVLCGLPVITWFNKLGGFNLNNASIGASDSDESTNPFMLDIQNIKGQFGHKVMYIDTVHGSYALVKEPIFRANSANYMAIIDMSKLAYRPLVGNGVSRDTHIMTNVQTPDKDSRLDMILTEAGLEFGLPECHAVYDFR